MHTLSRTTQNKKKKLVGRGGSRGKTSGRGGKGQTARAGNKRRPEMRDIIKKLPKLRGRGMNNNKGVTEKPQAVNLAKLNTLPEGTLVNRAVLLEKGMIRRIQGVLPQVKILATGTLTTKLSFSSDVLMSDAAKAKITAQGGTIR